MIRAVIFDLDGVVVSTDACHYEAWKQLADEEGIYFDRNINERLRGVSRMESLEIVLERSIRKYSEDEKIEMAQKKNKYYIDKIKKIDNSAMLPGAKAFIDKLKEKGILTAIGSSSKNAKLILNQTGCVGLFDVIADGNDIVNSKPAPDVFLLAAEKLEVNPSECIVVEDADAGIEAALAAGMEVLAVGYAKSNTKATYRASDLQEAESIVFNV